MLPEGGLLRGNRRRLQLDLALLRGVTRRLRTMVGLGHEQFADAAKLVLLVCDAQEGQWQGWLDRFEAVSQALATSGQTHQDLATLAELAAKHASDTGLPTEAVAATQLAVDQRKRLGGH